MWGWLAPILPWLGFVREFWQQLLPVAPAVVGLLALAWFALRLPGGWRVTLGALAVAALLVAGVVYSGRLFQRGWEAREAKLRADYTREIERREQALRDLDAAHKKREAADAKRIADLEKQAENTPPDERPGLDRKGAKRVRDIR